MSELATLQDLFVDQIKDLYSAENQLVQALPKMAASASNAQLKKSFETHLSQTQEHVSRLTTILDTLGADPKGKVCKAMQGLVAEGAETISEKATPAVKDAALIAAAQRAEHYEISGYGTARAFAQQLGQNEAVTLLERTLQEEKQTDELLTKLAESVININADQGHTTRK